MRIFLLLGMTLLAMANKRYGKSNATGAVNPLTLTCGECGTTNYVVGTKNPWVCYSCGHEN